MTIQETHVSKIEVQSVSVEYTNPSNQDRVLALDGVDLAIGGDEFLTLLGPSGSGKSTLLFAIAGLIRPSRGQILLKGRPIEGPGADRGLVFQDYALLPWRTARDNIALGLKIRNVARTKRDQVADDYIALFGLTGFADRYPHELSGGMRQRVAVARTLANQPEVVLMDEPFAAVDAQTRIVLGEELAHISATHRMTVAFVTHSVDEAVFLGDRVAIMSPRPGRIHQIFDVPIPRSQRTWETIKENATFIEITREAGRIIRGFDLGLGRS